jgi:hypothetical protein
MKNIPAPLPALMTALLLAFSAAAQAHHSPTMFDFQKQATVTGTVREFQWTNPHSYIQLKVKDDKGREQEWSFELGAPLYLYRHGWRPGTLKSGDTVTIKYAPLRPGKKKVHGGLAVEVRDASGKPFGKTLQEGQ